MDLRQYAYKLLDHGYDDLSFLTHIVEEAGYDFAELLNYIHMTVPDFLKFRQLPRVAREFKKECETEIKRREDESTNERAADARGERRMARARKRQYGDISPYW